MRGEYKTLLLSSLLGNFADNLIGPFYAVFVRQIGGSVLFIGYSAAMFSVAAGLLTVLIGALADRCSPRSITRVGYAALATGSLGYLLITSAWQLFALQIVFALGTACLAGPLKVLYAQFIESNHAGLQWALDDAGSYFVVAAAIVVGTFIVQNGGFPLLFLTMFALQLLALALQFDHTQPHTPGM